MNKKSSGLSGYIARQGGLWAKGSVDFLFFFFFLVIITAGLAMLYSATYPYAYTYNNGDSAYYLKKQLSGIAIGAVVMILLSKINYKVLMRPVAWGGFFGTIALLGLALAMPAYHGTHRYVYFGPIQVQPSDIAKLTLIMILAYILDTYHNVIVSKEPLNLNFAKNINKRFGRTVITTSSGMVLFCFFVIGLFALFVLAGSHLSGTLLLLIVGILVMMLGEVRWKWFVIGGIAAILVLVLAYETGLLKDYMEERIYAWQHKDYDPLGVRWQTNQALYAIGSGGFFGKGIGKSTQKFLYVSEPQNDMIFSIVVEELGFFGAALLIITFGLLVWRGVVIGINSDTRYGAIVAMGIVFQFAVQVILNILVATDSVPNTGISLPFFSYGRTSMVMNMAEMGLVMGISRTSKLKRR